MESYTPKELGIPFPEITAINIGVGCCPGVGTHYASINYFNAHTHQCNKDPHYKNICIPTKDYLFKKDGSMSDLLWHEYAHVLDDTYSHVKVVSCNINGGMHEFELPSTDEFKNWDVYGHGPLWRQIMKRFGKEPSLTVYLGA